ncbi:MAG TPA: hypothetical protein VKE94_08280 [Gemmataceae bacterium]|nr:hypothetical protein [Gemmataceae bacterium]
MPGFFRTVLGLFKPKPSGADDNSEPRGDCWNERLDGVQPEVIFRVPGMS